MENHYNCIYMYVNKINGKKYVGQAKNFNKRHNTHITSSYNKNTKHDYNVPFHKSIRKHGIKNFEVIILKENLNSQCLMNFWERYYIDKYNTLVKNKKGYNIASGGSNGNAFAGKTEEEMKAIFNDNLKKRQSESHKGEKNYMYGKHHTKEVKQKISKNHADNKGEKHPRARKVGQYDLQGNLIKIWNCIRDVQRELGICQSDISKCCRGKCKTAGGFIWKYAD